MSLVKWVKENFEGLELLGASTFQIRPGVILKPHGSSEVEAAAWQLLGESKEDSFWQTQRGPALLPSRDFSEENAGGGSIKVPGIVSLSFSSQRKVTASFRVEDVQVELLTNAFQSSIDAKLRERFKDTGSPVWAKFIDDHRIVTEAWYVKHLKVTFASEGGHLAKADVEHELNVSAEGNAAWKENDLLEVQSTGLIPFAVRTFRP